MPRSAAALTAPLLLRRLGQMPGATLRQRAEHWVLVSSAGREGATPIPSSLVSALLADGRLRRAGAGEARLAATGRPDFNDNESPLFRLHHRRDAHGRSVINDIQFAAGERLRADFERSHMTAKLTSSWDLPARGAPGQKNSAAQLSDGAIAARQRLARALEAVGPELAAILYQVCCLAAGMEQAERRLALPGRSGKAVLAMALTRLARHYGLLAAARPIGQGDIGHWTKAGFRPVVMPEGGTAE